MNNNLFTPSELVLLHGKRFIECLELDVENLYHIQYNNSFFQDRQVGSYYKKKIDLLDRSAKVSLVELGTAVYSVVILANVFADSIDLKVKQRNFLKKKIF